jgi:hypothetical protein
MLFTAVYFGFLVVVVVYLFIYSYVHTLFRPFLPHTPPSTPSFFPPPPSLPGRTCSALFSNFVEEKT